MTVLYKAERNGNLQQKLDELASSEREDDRMLAVLEHSPRKP